MRLIDANGDMDRYPLYTIEPDGSDITLVALADYGILGSGLFEAREWQPGSVVANFGYDENVYGGGAIGIYKIKQRQATFVTDIHATRILSARIEGRYKTPYPLKKSGLMLASFSPGWSLDAEDGKAPLADYRLVLLDTDTGKNRGRMSRRKLITVALTFVRSRIALPERSLNRAPLVGCA